MLTKTWLHKIAAAFTAISLIGELKTFLTLKIRVQIDAWLIARAFDSVGVLLSAELSADPWCCMSGSNASSTSFYSGEEL